MQDVSEDWPTLVVSGLERCLEKRSTYENTKEYLALFENACSRKNLYDLEQEEFSGRLKSLREKACSILMDDGQDASIRFSCAEMLHMYVTYGRDFDVASSFEEVSSACLSFLKQRKKDGVHETVGLQLLERGVVRMHSMSDDVQITRGSAGVVSKIGGLCAQMLQDQNLSEPSTCSLLGCLGACLLGFPSSLKHVEKLLEDRIGALLLKGGACMHASAVVFAMLPRISGSGEAWGRCSQRLLVSTHKYLDTLLDGLGTVENLNLDSSVEPLLLHGEKKSQMVLFSEYMESVRGLITSLTRLISGSFQVAVPMPIHGILGLCRRLMNIDVTRIRTIETVGRTAGQVAILAIHLSTLQKDALCMLRKLMQMCQGGIIIPHIYDINSILARYLDSVSMLWAHDSDISDESVLRQVLQCVKESIRIDGVAGTTAFFESIKGFATSTISPYLKGGNEDILLKKSTKTYFARHEYAGRMLLVAMKCHADILGVIEAMFESSALLGEERLYMEDFVLHVATSLCQLVEHTSLHVKGDVTRISIAFHAALKALAAAIAAPSIYRPVHASEALILFRKTASLPLADIRSVSLKAISYLELSMHPKSLTPPVGTAEALGKYGMPSFWSFLEYDGTAKETYQEEVAIREQDDNTETSTKPSSAVVEADMSFEDLSPKMTGKRTRQSSIIDPASKKRIDPAIEFKIPTVQEESVQPQQVLPLHPGKSHPPTQRDDDSESDFLPEIDSGGEDD